MTGNATGPLHASRHSTGAADAIAPDSIGAILRDKSYTADPGAPRMITRITATVTSSFSNLAENYINSALASWRNEWGALRGSAHSNSKFDALVRAIGRTDYSGAVHQGAGYAAFETISSARDQQHWGRHWVDGALFREAVKHMDLFVWKTGDPDPTTDTTGQFSYGSASTGYTASISSTTFVILIQNASTDSTPSWAPAGRTLRFNLA